MTINQDSQQLAKLKRELLEKEKEKQLQNTKKNDFPTKWVVGGGIVIVILLLVIVIIFSARNRRK